MKNHSMRGFLGNYYIFKFISRKSFLKSDKFSILFGSRKILKKDKNTKENDFFMFGCLMKNIKENQI